MQCGVATRSDSLCGSANDGCKLRSVDTLFAGPGHELNRLWLKPTPLNPEFTPSVLQSGQKVGVIRPFSAGPGCTILFHGVIVAVGPLTPELAAENVLASLGYRR
jgi:hypothetical protein